MRSICTTSLRVPVLAAVLPLLLSALPGPLAGQQFREITGRVLGPDGQGLATANVLVEGTTFGTLTNEDGSFELEVPNRDVRLTFRLIGYKFQTLPLPLSQDHIEVTLESDILGLDEIVVSGRATQMARRNVTAHISRLPSEDLVRAEPSTLEQSLYGKVSGINIQSNSGAPGGGLQINLRGVTTVIGEFKPLYIVDGVIVNNETTPSGVFAVTGSSDDPVRGGSQDNAPNRIADLNPKEIESIEILKGAAATAQYGSKASNGVILITTKRGRPGELEWRIGSQFGVADNSERLGLRRFESREDAAAAFGDDVADLWEPGAFFDHEKAISSETPFLYSIDASVTGGGETTSFYGSGLVRDEGGIVPNTFANKQSLRLNMQHTASDRLSLNVNTNGIHTVSDRGFTNNDNRNVSLWVALGFTPSFVDLGQLPDGTFPDNPGTRSNPLQTVAFSDNEEEVWRFIGSTDVDYTAIQSESQSLRFRGLGGIDVINQRNALLTPPQLQFEADDGLLGTAILGDVESLNYNLEGNAIHELILGGGTRVTTSAGLQFEVRDSDFFRNTAQNLVAGQTNIDRATVVGVREVQSREEDLGFFLQEEMLIGNKLALVAGFRADQSSNNADVDDLTFFPRGAASYVFDDLISGTLDELKLRVAYGESGNRPLFGQKFTQLQGAVIEGLGTVSVGGVTAAQDLKPERQREIEGGIDATLFDERMTLSVTGYNKWVVDVLLQRELAPSTGFATSIFNGGKLRARGVEASLSAAPVQSENLKWDLRGTFSLNRTEMLKLPVEPFQVEGFGFLFGTFQLAQGESLTAMWGNVTRDDGTVTTGVIGDANPNFRAGFQNSLSYKDVTFNMVWDWQAGSSVFNLTQLLFDLGQNSPDCNVLATGGLPGESVCAERLRLWPTNTEVYLESATFLKARELSLSWELPEGVRRLLFPIARSAELSFEGRDVFTFTPYSGLDPEVSNFGGAAIGRNVDVGPFPPSRKFWVTVDLTL